MPKPPKRRALLKFRYRRRMSRRPSTRRSRTRRRCPKNTQNTPQAPARLQNRENVTLLTAAEPSEQQIGNVEQNVSGAQREPQNNGRRLRRDYKYRGSRRRRSSRRRRPKRAVDNVASTSKEERYLGAGSGLYYGY